MRLLRFSPGKDNAKLKELAKHFGGKVYTFSLISGHTCPFAKDCLSKAIKVNDKFVIEDGPYTKFRCFSASQEVLYKGVREQRQYNTDLLKEQNSMTDMANLIVASLPKDAKVVRIHVGGDFFNRDYFRAWVATAMLKPDIIFYAYTKSLKFWVLEIMNIPRNFILTASYGGYADELIAKHNLRYAKVVYSEDEANKLGLEIDHDDIFAAKPEKRNVSFALLLHGVQPKNTEAASALKALKGVGSYSHKKTKV